MFSSAEKTKNVTVQRQQQPAGQTFFRKAGEGSFYGAKESPSFFAPAVQAKLSVSSPDDPQEKEADEVAEQVMRMPVSINDSTNTNDGEQKLQRKEKEDDDEQIQTKLETRVVDINRQGDKEEENIQAKLHNTIHRSAQDLPGERTFSTLESTDQEVQRKTIPLFHSDVIRQSGRGPPQSIISFNQALTASKGGGSALSDSTKQMMESRFNADFSGVRVHAGFAAENMSENVGAQAFTHGDDIYFNTGKFSPHTTDGSLLLAHELTHVMQQRGKISINAHKYTVRSLNNSLLDQVTHKSFPARTSNMVAQTAVTSSNENRPASMNIAAVKQPGKAATTKPGFAYSPPIEKESKPSLSDKKVSSKKDDAIPDGKEIPRAPKNPGKDPGFRMAKRQVSGESQKQKKHDPESKKKEATVNASAMEPGEQRDQDSVEKTTEEMEKTGAEQEGKKKDFNADKFKEELRKRINDKKPTSESKAKEFAKTPPVEHFEEDFSKDVAKEQSLVTGPLEDKANNPPTGGVDQKTAIPIPEPVYPPAPGKIDPKLATPKSKTEQEISLQHESDRIDGTMEENRMSDNQLAESREPDFIETLKVKEVAKQKVAEAPAIYRQQEAEILKGAEGEAHQLMSGELSGMNKVNKNSGKDIFGTQGGTESKTETRQRTIKKEIDGIYNDTVTCVKCILEEMTTKVKKDFSDSLKNQTEIFNASVKRRISNYYGDWRIDDALFGPDPVVVKPDGKTRSMTFEEKLGIVQIESINPDVYEIFVDEKDNFIKSMDVQLDIIAKDVENGLTAAHNQIINGEKRIADFKATLSVDEQAYATTLEGEVKLKFESLEASIDDAREDLLQTMADEYSENVGQLEKTFKDINDELKKSWIDRAIEFVKTVGKTIFQLAELLLSILVRVAYLIWDIIKHPIRFFETLVSGLKQGIGSFIDNIGTHMKEAFWTWITGATPGKTIRLSLGDGVAGLFDMALQVLNLGPQELRAIVDKKLGKEFLQMVDKGIALGEKLLEPVIILLTKGPMAFWEYIKDTVGDIIQSSFERIRESVFNAFIENGLKWIAGFFIPGGGFVKIVKAIVKAFQFVAENLENIRNFFDSIFDSMEAAVEGKTEGVANKIVAGLKIAMVLALDFLAKQLGMDKIINSVQKIIQSLRRPIVSAIEFILGKAKPFVMKMMRKGKELVAKGKQKVKSAAGKLLNFLGIKKDFKDKEGESHKLFFKGTNKDPQLVVASDPIHIGNWVTKRKQELKTSGKLDSSMNSLFAKVQKLMQEIKSLTYDDGKAKRKPEDVINDIAVVIAAIGIGSEIPVPNMVRVPGFSSVQANGSITVRYLFNDKNNHKAGSGTTGREKLDGAMVEIKNAGLGSYWSRGHILNKDFGGLAVDSNLIPIDQTTNLKQIAFDNLIRTEYDKKEVPVSLDFDVERHADDKRFVSSYRGTAKKMKEQGTSWTEENVIGQFSASPINKPAAKAKMSIKSLTSDSTSNKFREVGRANNLSVSLLKDIVASNAKINTVDQLKKFISNNRTYSELRKTRYLNRVDSAERATMFDFS